jgi:hypothetical protein
MNVFLILGGGAFAFFVGRRAKHMGKSFLAWFLLSLIISPLISWLILEIRNDNSEINLKGLNSSDIFRRNLVITFILIFVLLGLFTFVPGYNYAIKDVAIGNKQRIDQIETRRLNFNLPELRQEDKLLFRIEDYWYIQYITAHTPDTAVILLPPASAIDTTPEFNQLSDAEWMEYFLYPRLCISEDQRETKKELYAKVTHVAIVNSWGYDKLKYQPHDRPTEAVLPITEPLNEPIQSPANPIKPGFFADSAGHKSTIINQQ